MDKPSHMKPQIVKHIPFEKSRFLGASLCCGGGGVGLGVSGFRESEKVIRVRLKSPSLQIQWFSVFAGWWYTLPPLKNITVVGWDDLGP